MEDTLNRITSKKLQLEKHLLPAEVQKNLTEWLTVELTYSSNAIEGNTLTRVETAEVIERGVSAVVSGKPLKDLLEARNHAEALEYIRALAKRLGHQRHITESEILSIHHLVLRGIADEWAGQYRQTDVMVKGAFKEFTRPQAISYAMQEFLEWLHRESGEHPVRIAAQAHYNLVSIHPFADGNGRTARLLMNLILLMHGYPMAVIRNEERTAYIASFHAADEGNMALFYAIVDQAVERSLDAYLKALAGKGALISLTPKMHKTEQLLKIGELSKRTGESMHTLRFWTQRGLLTVSGQTEGGYHLYSPKMIDRVKRIRQLQDEKRLTLSEIREQLSQAA